jgi:preprotein translocase SecE subunit
MKQIRGFLAEVWREVHPTRGRVVWPSWDKVVKSTWVVVIMSALAGLFIWAADTAFGQIIQGILFN